MSVLEQERQASLDANGQEEDHAATYVTFDLAGQTFGVDVRNVREILDCVQVAVIPNAPPEIEGMIDIRGESIPIMDLSSRLGLHRLGGDRDTRIIVFELQRDSGPWAVGVLAEQVRDVTQIASGQIEPPPNLGSSGLGRSNLSGLARQNDLLILLLDVARVFPDEGQTDTFSF